MKKVIRVILGISFIFYLLALVMLLFVGVSLWELEVIYGQTYR